MTEFALYQGNPTGCLPRTSLVGSTCPLLSTRIETLPDDVLSQYEDVDLSHLVRKIKYQNPAGSCAAESSTLADEVGRESAGQAFEELNSWFVYYHTGGQRDRGDGRSGGSEIDTNLAFIRENGVAPISVWPRIDNGWRTKPSAEAYEAAKSFKILEFYDITSIAEAKTAIVLGMPVVYGANGHSVLKVAMNGKDANSWGTTWKDAGFGVWVPFNRINWNYGAFAVRVATWKVPAELSACMRNLD